MQQIVSVQCTVISFVMYEVKAETCNWWKNTNLLVPKVPYWKCLVEMGFSVLNRAAGGALNTLIHLILPTPPLEDIIIWKTLWRACCLSWVVVSCETIQPCLSRRALNNAQSYKVSINFGEGTTGIAISRGVPLTLTPRYLIQNAFSEYL